jgi:hypothetical protein
MFYSQIGQDSWVCEVLNFKQNGTFLDIGCHHYKNISNTYYLETELNWSGIGIDNNSSFGDEWNLHRLNSKFLCLDATNIDYLTVLTEHNMPKIIDYMTLDLEPPELSLIALQKLMECDYTFRTVTFETDWYRVKTTQDISRELMISKGYKLIKEVGSQDDFYIHPDYV